MKFAFTKYHALGNDYIVIDPKNLPAPLTTEQVKTICHRNYGVGSDGILLGPLPAKNAPFGLRIFNPDGSEAEKSGNGLRIFSRYLWDKKLVGKDEFAIETPGGVVKATVTERGKVVRVEMGKVSFWSDEIPIYEQHSFRPEIHKIPRVGARQRRHRHRRHQRPRAAELTDIVFVELPEAGAR
jgi:diaminopimelate epimerase